MRNVKFLAGFLCALLLVGSIGLALPVERAFAQDSLTPGTAVEGSIKDGEEVNYTIDAQMGQLILISMESEDFDTYVVISDADGNELAHDDDSGAGNNAMLAFVAQADGTFTVTAKASWSGEGSFVLTPNVIVPDMVELNGSVTLKPAEGDQAVYAIFAADADTVVDLWANTRGEDDLRIEVFGVDALSIDDDDNDGADTNPMLRRVVLPDDGLYLVKVTPSWSDDPLTAGVDLKVDVTEQLFITEEPHTVALSDDDLGTEVFTFEAVYGTVYRITVVCELNTGVDMRLLDTSEFFDPDFETGSATKVTWEYKSDVDGQVRIDVHPSFFSDGDTLTFSIETVE